MAATALLALSLLAGGPAAAHAETAPAVTTGTASEIALTSATLSGSVASSLPLSSCWFEWGIPPRFEHSSPCRPPPGEGSSAYVSGEATGMQLSTTYVWRLAASSAAGVAHGETASLTTLGYPIEEQADEGSEPAALVERPPALAPVGGKPLAHGRFEDGLYVAYCPRPGEPGVEIARAPRAGPATANHAGWPPLQCLKMDKGTYGRPHTLRGLPYVHNWLLGGYGNDTIWGGEDGDVIWADYHPSGQSTSEHDVIHGGAGTDWIYSSHGYNEIWTGAGDDHLALVYGRGVVHCNGPGLKTLVMRYIPRNRHWRLIGCDHIRIEPYRA